MTAIGEPILRIYMSCRLRVSSNLSCPSRGVGRSGYLNGYVTPNLVGQAEGITMQGTRGRGAKSPYREWRFSGRPALRVARDLLIPVSQVRFLHGSYTLFTTR